MVPLQAFSKLPSIRTISVIADGSQGALHSQNGRTLARSSKLSTHT